MNGSKRLTPIGTESFHDDVQQMRFEAIASAVDDEPVMELTCHPEAEKEAMLMKATQPQKFRHWQMPLCLPWRKSYPDQLISMALVA